MEKKDAGDEWILVHACGCRFAFEVLKVFDDGGWVSRVTDLVPVGWARRKERI